MADLQELETLHSLYQKGILSEAEYNTQKERLLNAPVIEEKPMIPIGEAYKLYWKKSFVWKGRATRAEYWWPVLVNFLIAIAANFLPDIFAIPYLIFSIAMIFPGLAVYVRRFHDINLSAWIACLPCLLILGLAVVSVIGIVVDYVTAGSGVLSGFRNVRSIIFIVGGFLLVGMGIATFVCTLLPGTKGPNKYGEPR